MGSQQLSKLNCAVFGGGGFIGTNLCRALNGRVNNLCAFGRRKAFPEAISSVKWFNGDFRNASDLTAMLQACDIVYHLVNSSTPASGNFNTIEDLESNVSSTLQLLDACRQANIKKIIFISSGGTIYGLTKVVPTPEDSPTNPITSYGIGKLTIEKYLSLYKHLYNIDYTILRVANPFGPYQTTHKNQGAIAAFIEKALKHKPVEIWGDGFTVRDYIYIDDVIDCLILATTYEGNEKIFNVGSGSGKTLIDIINEIEIFINSKISIEFKESRPVDIPVNVLDISKAQQELGWIPRTSFTDGIIKTIEWMNNK